MTQHTDTSPSGDLVKMLRAGDLCGLTLAADRIEALEAENERLREALREARRLNNLTVINTNEVSAWHRNVDGLLEGDENERWDAPHRVEHRRMVERMFTGRV